MRTHRQHVGPRFTEGARLLWSALDAAGLTPSEAAKRLGWLRSTLAHVLYGDRLPGISLLSDVKREFGVDLEAWNLEPTEPFVPPAAREPAEPDAAEEPSEGAA